MRVSPIPPSWSYLRQPEDEHPPDTARACADVADSPDTTVSTSDLQIAHDTVSSTSTLENPSTDLMPDPLQRSIVQRLMAKRATSADQAKPAKARRSFPSRPCKHRDTILRIPKEEYERLGGITGVANKYGIPRTTLGKYVDHFGDTRPSGRARLEHKEYAFSQNNLRALSRHGKALRAAAGGFSKLASALGVQRNQLREVLTPSGKLSRVGGQMLVDNTPIPPRSVEIPQERFNALLSGVPPGATRRLPPIQTIIPMNAAPFMPGITTPTSAPATSASSSRVAQFGECEAPALRPYVRTEGSFSPAMIPVVDSTTAWTRIEQARRHHHLHLAQNVGTGCDPVPNVNLHWLPEQQATPSAFYRTSLIQSADASSSTG
ncbi:hypothetical protein PAQ31011_01383 [Pandoraea aquatica]|uniref:Uncharacterized protein n=2 Tax=Pandoraea aquatica TaxID=2508290 RepID=A0A5E4TDA3_9BURK|nr:hypothetical protein PAQ31011_01383 [Pandoraea aquatica]